MSTVRYVVSSGRVWRIPSGQTLEDVMAESVRQDERGRALALRHQNQKGVTWWPDDRWVRFREERYGS